MNNREEKIKELMKSKILTRNIQEGGNDILPAYEKTKEKKIISKLKSIKDKDIYSIVGQFGYIKKEK